MKTKITITFVALLCVVLILHCILPINDCGESALYTKEERQDAAKLISDTVESFKGCKLYAVKYEGDEVSKKNLEYCNSLAADGVTYSESIVFTSYFRSPIFNAGAWNPNDLYSWSWYLARPMAVSGKSSPMDMLDSYFAKSEGFDLLFCGSNPVF